MIGVVGGSQPRRDLRAAKRLAGIVSPPDSRFRRAAGKTVTLPLPSGAAP